MKLSPYLLAVVLAIPSGVYAGDPSAKEIVPIEDPKPFVDARRPISNPTLFDLAIPRTKIHPLFLTQSMPSHLKTTLGKVPAGGDLQVYAIQAEWALNERFALVASKDGYIVFDPDFTFSDTSGWANIAAGAKWAWLFKPEQGLASSIQLVYEIPSGDSDVWQGTGEGQLIPAIYLLKMAGKAQFSGALGGRIPVDDSDTSSWFTSAHAGYHVTPWFYPLIEVNWFHVIDPGSGEPRFGAQAGGLTPAIAQFEAGDLVNWGAANSGTYENLVTLAIGFRANCPQLENVDFGFAWEFPLTDEEATILENRFTFDVEISF